MIKLYRMVAVLCVTAIAGCSSGEWKTDYSDMIDANVAKSWRVASVNVAVPDTLTVSEANTYAPSADIVWRGDDEGDRRAQVATIIKEAAERGAADLRGGRAVDLNIEVTQFHALSDLARTRLTRSGVHNIEFNAQIVDARTGEPLTEVDDIRADLVAYTGIQAFKAIADGQTQRVRITDHVAKVIAGWLGTGEDVRGAFKRLGR